MAIAAKIKDAAKLPMIAFFSLFIFSSCFGGLRGPIFLLWHLSHSPCKLRKSYLAPPVLMGVM